MSDYLEMPSCCHNIVCKARKQHKCCECNKPIWPGDRYVYTSRIWAGRASDFKQCLICDEVATRFIDESVDSVGLECLREAISECWSSGDTYESCAKCLGVSVEKIKHVLGENWYDEET